MWEICDVQPFLLLPTVLDLRLLFRKLFMVAPDLLALLDAGIALQGLITQVYLSNVCKGGGEGGGRQGNVYLGQSIKAFSASHEL